MKSSGIWHQSLFSAIHLMKRASTPERVLKALHAASAVGRFLLKPLMRSIAACRSPLSFWKSCWQLAGAAKAWTTEKAWAAEKRSATGT